MLEMIRNAAGGWVRYTEAGKYAVLLLGLLLWTGYQQYQKKGQEAASQQFSVQQKCFWWYTAVTTVFAICPLTAALWMGYQTRFYDYEWIWSAVPVTGFIAAAASGCYVALLNQPVAGHKWKTAGAVLCGLAVLWLCGSMGTERVQGMWTVSDVQKEQSIQENGAMEAVRELIKVQEELTDEAEGLCVWAPADILAHIREQNAEIRLLYGRNMWENALNAYSYDTYDAEVIELYEWMEELTIVPEEGVPLPELDRQMADQKLKTALEYGVNCIVLPGIRADMADWVAQAALTGGRQCSLRTMEEAVICILK